MVIDPGTAMLIATAVSTAAQGIGGASAAKKAKKAAKLRAQEMKRETHAGLLEDTLQGEAELEANRLKRRAKMGQRSSQSMQDTADLVRGAFNI